MTSSRDATLTQAVADGFDVTPAALTGAAGVFAAEGDALADVVATLTAQLDSLGPCWGGDSVGNRFGTAYQDAGLRVLDNMRALGTGMQRIAGALRAIANSYELIDGCLPTVPPTRPPDLAYPMPIGPPVDDVIYPMPGERPVYPPVYDTPPERRVRIPERVRDPRNRLVAEP
jgi:uncharacterized protein YukE